MRHLHGEGIRCPVPGCPRERAIADCERIGKEEYEAAIREGREPRLVAVMLSDYCDPSSLK